MNAWYNDVEFANVMKKLPTGYYLVFPIKGTPYLRPK